ncbi:LysR substrate-binding domain-containing protein [Pseudorhodoferax soli]|uniref:LysR substrate-binding domain-containing protein n=1 Tax=Pseudorhodoferax soli TaxID=545864 RepID=UPI001FE45FE6|nr:LysR substrate-binding domain-containing protein [Pseudorhodoferax soli]
MDRAEDLQGLLAGDAISLRLGASTTIANYRVPGYLAALRRQHPDARINLTVGNTSAVIADVASMRVDIGLIEGGCHHPDLTVVPWTVDELVVFVTRGHALAQLSCAVMLADAAWLLREQGSGTREEFERKLLPHLGRLRVDMELGDSESIKRAVAAGLGISCLSRSVVVDLLASGDVVEISGLPVLARTLYRIQHRARSLTRGVTALLKILTLETMEDGAVEVRNNCKFERING